MDVTPWTPAGGTVTMFTTPWCGFCVRLKRQLTDADISFTEVDMVAYKILSTTVVSSLSLHFLIENHK